VITTKRKYLAVAGLLGFTGTLVLLFCYPPDQYSFYPRCLFHSLTGLQCPGCGGLRATHYLLHGDVASAFRLNQLFVLLLPFMLLFSVGRLVKLVLRKSDDKRQQQLTFAGANAIELAPPVQVFSVAPRETNEERAGERGVSVLTAKSNRKQDGPPLPGPLLPQREERENPPLLFFADSMAVWHPFCLWALLVVVVLFTILRNLR